MPPCSDYPLLFGALFCVFYLVCRQPAVEICFSFIVESFISSLVHFHPCTTHSFFFIPDLLIFVHWFLHCLISALVVTVVGSLLSCIHHVFVRLGQRHTKTQSWPSLCTWPIFGNKGIHTTPLAVCCSHSTQLILSFSSQQRGQISFITLRERQNTNVDFNSLLYFTKL